MTLAQTNMKNNLMILILLLLTLNVSSNILSSSVTSNNKDTFIVCFYSNTLSEKQLKIYDSLYIVYSAILNKMAIPCYRYDEKKVGTWTPDSFRINSKDWLFHAGYIANSTDTVGSVVRDFYCHYGPKPDYTFDFNIVYRDYRTNKILMLVNKHNEYEVEISYFQDEKPFLMTKSYLDLHNDKNPLTKPNLMVYLKDNKAAMAFFIGEFKNGVTLNTTNDFYEVPDYFYFNADMRKKLNIKTLKKNIKSWRHVY